MVLDDFSREMCIRQSCEYGRYFTIDSTNNQLPSSSGKRQIHVAVLLPAKENEHHSDKPVQTLSTTLPVIELAIEAVKELKLLEGIELVTHARDTETSSTIGPMAAFDLHNHHQADVFLGPIDDYVLAPVARFATVWRTPVLTTGGLAGAFDNKVKKIFNKREKTWNFGVQQQSVSKGDFSVAENLMKFCKTSKILSLPNCKAFSAFSKVLRY